MRATAMPSLRLGIDLGGTWLRAVLADAHGRVLGRSRMPAVDWRRLPDALRRLRRGLGFHRLGLLTVGSKGLWSKADRSQARKALATWARRVRVVSDVELAQAAAFAGGAGILVVAGTGSIALARDRRGRIRRAGGWGPLLGDQGSAFWIGRCAAQDQGLRRKLGLDPLKLAHGANPVRAVAGVAPKVLRLAKTDVRARRIRDAATRHLADLAAEAGRGLDFGGPLPVSWRGGLFQDRDFRARFARELRRRLRGSELIPPRLPAELAAAALEW